MKVFKLITRTLRYYWGSNLATAAGIAVTTAVICGALIVGSSLKKSLLSIVEYRLGQTTHTLTAGERVFTASLAQRFERASNFPAAAVLKSEAVLALEGGGLSLEKVQIWGVDASFAHFAHVEPDQMLIEDGEALISQNIADVLQVNVGDHLMLRIKHIGPIPSNTPFVSDEQQRVSKSIRIKGITPKKSYGLFNLQNAQSAPYNLFVSLQWLNSAMESSNSANVLLMDADASTKVESLESLVRGACIPQDLNLLVNAAGDDRQIVTSERVFVDEYSSEKLLQTFPSAKGYLTYFVNGLRYKGKETPYSFVTALSENPLPSAANAALKSNEMVVNAWLANDLGIGIGDTLQATYWVFGSLRSLIEKQHAFVVVGILPMSEAAKDGILMPYLPGLSDAGNCREWKSGIPIDLKKIRDKDEAYWNVYKGSPKAYIALETGQALWQNQFGKLTSLILNAKQVDRNVVQAKMVSSIDPFKTEFRINPVLKDGLTSANNGVDFAQLFIGLGMFVIAAGLILTMLLFNLNLKKRAVQIKLFNALGFTAKRIRILVLSEFLGIALLGGVLGMVLSIAYSKLVFIGLHKIWFDIVRTDMLSLHIDPLTLLLGTLLSIATGMIAVFFNIRNMLKQPLKVLEAAAPRIVKNRPNGLAWKLSTVLMGLVLLYVLIIGPILSTMAWFILGLLLLSALLFYTNANLNKAAGNTTQVVSEWQLSLRNLRRNPSRSFSVLILLALGTFAVVMTAANKKSQETDNKDKTSGTGGFDYVAETTIPILQNLNDSAVQLKYGLPAGLHFVHFLSAYDDDASCLNLNKIANPRILSVDPQTLIGRFQFATAGKDLDPKQPWLSLDKDLGDVIPAVGDQTVLEWGMGKKVGDTITYKNLRGESVKLLLIGGLANSVFQGNLLISNKAFKKHFLENGGSNFMLIENQSSIQNLPEELAFYFKEYGWTSMESKDKLAEFGAIENTYLNIFFLMGAFAMLLGTIGLAIRVLGSLIDRKKETAMLQSFGFSRAALVRIFSYEFLTLLFVGTFIGCIAAVVSTLPTLLSNNATVSFSFVALVLGIILMNGVLWIVLSARIMLGKTNLTFALRNE